MPTLNRSSYAVKDLADLLRIITKTLTIPEITPEIQAILWNTSAATIIEQLEGLLEPFLRKRTSSPLTLTGSGVNYTVDLTTISDYKRPVALIDTTSNSIIEFKTAREFQNAKKSSMFNSTPIALLAEGKIYIYIPAGANITLTTIYLDYIRQIEKCTAYDIIGQSSGVGRIVREMVDVVSGGTSGWAVGNICKLTGTGSGTVTATGRDALFRVSSVSSGQVTAMECIYGGEYSVLPTANTALNITPLVVETQVGTPTVKVKTLKIFDVPDEFVIPVMNDVKIKLLEIAGNYTEANQVAGQQNNILNGILQSYPFNTAKREEK